MTSLPVWVDSVQAVAGVVPVVLEALAVAVQQVMIRVFWVVVVAARVVVLVALAELAATVVRVVADPASV
jgi:hypothetical protein